MPRLHVQFFLILIHNLLIQPHLILKNIHIRTRKFPSRHAPLKQQIQLGETPSTRFRNPEIRVNDTEEADSSPEEAGEVRPVPVTGVEHVGCEHGADDADDVVKVAAEDDGLDL